MRYRDDPRLEHLGANGWREGNVYAHPEVRWDMELPSGLGGDDGDEASEDEETAKTYREAAQRTRGKKMTEACMWHLDGSKVVIPQSWR